LFLILKLLTHALFVENKSFLRISLEVIRVENEPTGGEALKLAKLGKSVSFLDRLNLSDNN